MKTKFKIIPVVVWVLCIALFLGAWDYASSATLEITWNANTETDLAGYKVYSKATNAATWRVDDVGKALKLDIPNMAENLEYCAQVSAYDTAGNESGKSVASCDLLDTVPPAAPTGVKAKLLKLLAWLKAVWG